MVGVVDSNMSRAAEAGSALAPDLKIGFFGQHVSQPLAKHGVIVHEENLYGLRSRFAHYFLFVDLASASDLINSNRRAIVELELYSRKHRPAPARAKYHPTAIDVWWLLGLTSINL
jgi:hypothetical protein